jgi:NADH-quinone oxidoreductase subunit A
VKDEIIEVLNQLIDSKIILTDYIGTLQYFFYDSSRIYSDCFPILLFLLVAFFLTLILLASFFVAIQKPETEKLSSYECGFEPYEDARNTFDIKFYLVAILFIVFDIETMYLFPWSVSLSNINVLGYWSMVDFIIELSVGLIYVWYIGGLDWD